MAKITKTMVGEALVGDGNEVAHIDLLIGPRGSPAEDTFCRTLTSQREGVNGLLAGIAPNLPCKPNTILYNKVTIKQQKSRWASCSKKQNLNFNLFLSAAPLQVIDYVIVHELVHTIEMNHSKRFWEIVSSANAEFRDHKAWLEDHSPIIGVQGL